MAPLKTAIAYLTGFFLLLLPFVTGAVLPNSINSLLASRQTSSTKLCDGDKINGALLNTFTPKNPPSQALLEQCNQLFVKRPQNINTAGTTANSPSVPSASGPVGVSCDRYRHPSRTVDIHVAILHLLRSPNQAVEYLGFPVQVFRWGEAAIFFDVERKRPTLPRNIFWTTNNVARAAATVLDRCANGIISSNLRLHGWWREDIDILVYKVEVGERIAW